MAMLNVAAGPGRCLPPAGLIVEQLRASPEAVMNIRASVIRGGRFVFQLLWSELSMKRCMAVPFVWLAIRRREAAGAVCSPEMWGGMTAAGTSKTPLKLRPCGRPLRHRPLLGGLQVLRCGRWMRAISHRGTIGEGLAGGSLRANCRDGL